MHIDGWTLALQALNATLLLWLLNRFLFQPVLQLLERRRRDEAQRQADLSQAQATLAAQLATVAEQQASWAAREQALLAQAQAQAQALIAQARQDAQAQAEALLAQAQAEAQAQHQAATADWLAQAGDLAVALAQRLLADAGAQLPQLHTTLLDALLQAATALPAAQRPAADDPALTLHSALPLSTATQAHWQSQLSQAWGQPVRLQLQHQPDLLCGAELHWGHGLLQRHWAADLARYRAALHPAESQP